MWEIPQKGGLSRLLPPGGYSRVFPGLWQLPASPGARWPLDLLGSTWGHYLFAQAKDLASTFGAMCLAHLQRYGSVVTLVSPQLGVEDVPLGPGSHHAHWLTHLLVSVWSLMMHWPHSWLYIGNSSPAFFLFCRPCHSAVPLSWPLCQSQKRHLHLKQVIGFEHGVYGVAGHGLHAVEEVF